MLKRSWLFLLPLIGALLIATPARAATPSWTIDGINRVGCDTNGISLPVTFKGTVDQGFTAHTQAFSNGQIFMDEIFTYTQGDGQTEWGIYNTFDGGPYSNQGTWPMQTGHPVTLRINLEKPLGTIVTSWTMVLQSCDTGRIYYNGLTALDKDGDYVPTPKDLCPKLRAIGRADGCPLRDRTLTLAAKTGPKRVGGRLYAAGFPTLYANRPVVIWKIRSGPDLKIATLTTSSGGYFSKTVGSGYYYATSSAYRSPSSGVAAADRSPNVHVN